MKIVSKATLFAIAAATLAIGAGSASAGTCDASNAAANKIRAEILQEIQKKSNTSHVERLDRRRRLYARDAFRIEDFDQQKGLFGVRDIDGCQFEASWHVKLYRKLQKDRFGRLIVTFLRDNSNTYDHSKGSCYISSYPDYDFKWEHGAPIIGPEQGKSFARHVVNTTLKVCWTHEENPRIVLPKDLK